MKNHMLLRLTAGPINGHIRAHTERDGWDEPEVYYLRRQKGARLQPIRLHNSSEDKLTLEFANVEVTVTAIEEHIEIVFREIPRLRAA